MNENQSCMNMTFLNIHHIISDLLLLCCDKLRKVSEVPEVVRIFDEEDWATFLFENYHSLFIFSFSPSLDALSVSIPFPICLVLKFSLKLMATRLFSFRHYSELRV